MERDTDLSALHRQVLRTQVRVRTAEAGGSGTIIYSRPSGAGHADYSSFAITCFHVVDSAVTVKDEWDPKVGRQRKIERRSAVSVESFDWDGVPHGQRPLTASVMADIEAYDKDHDMALLRLRKTAATEPVASLWPADKIEQLRVGYPVYAVGAALLHDPILTFGHITHQGDEIDHKIYDMASAQIIFGNSGGAVFAELDGRFCFIGIPSRVDVVGWGSPVTHLGYFSPVRRVYEFLEEQLFGFLVPGSDQTEEGCRTLREERKEAEERRLILERG